MYTIVLALERCELFHHSTYPIETHVVSLIRISLLIVPRRLLTASIYGAMASVPVQNLLLRQESVRPSP